MNNILFDGETKRITALLDFDWTAITHPCDVFLTGLWDIWGGIGDRCQKVQENILNRRLRYPLRISTKRRK